VPNFVSFAASAAVLAHEEKSRTREINHSLNHSPSLFDALGTEAFTLEHSDLQLEKKFQCIEVATQNNIV